MKILLCLVSRYDTFLKLKSQYKVLHGVAQSSCLFCKAQRQIRDKNGKKQKNPINVIDYGFMNILYVFGLYKIIIHPTQKICMACNIDPLNKEKLFKLPMKNFIKKEHEKICIQIIKLKRWQVGMFIIEKQPKYKIILKDLNREKSVLHPTEYKYLFGLTREQWLKIHELFIEEMYKYFTKHKTKQLILKRNNQTHSWIYNLTTPTDQNHIHKSIMCMLLKWKLNSNVRSMSRILNIGINQFSDYILRFTSIGILFTSKYLFNTKKELATCYNAITWQLLEIPKSMNVVIGDGCRFKILKPTSFEDTYLSFDAKHKMNSLNLMGFCSIDGDYIGFYPKIYTMGSDGSHPDGFALDFILLNNTNEILKLIKPNTQKFNQDGTKILFDRAIPHGCVVNEKGLFNINYPCNSKGLQTQYQANNTRSKTTIHRWAIESCFGRLASKWRIFKAATSDVHPKNVSIFAVWCDIAAAIFNALGLSKNKKSAERILQTKWMLNRKISLQVGPMDKSRLNIIGEKYKLPSSIKNIWIKAKTPRELYDNAPFWNKQKIQEYFDLNEKEIAIFSGGKYTLSQGELYVTHSRMWIEIYYSTKKHYQDIIMIRGIKRKFSRFYQKNQEIHAIRRDYPTHNIYLSKKENMIENIFNEEEYTPRMRSLDFWCDCLIGSRTINPDSHIMCGLLYLCKYWINGIQANITDEKRLNFSEMIDIKGWVTSVKTLSHEGLDMFCQDFLKHYESLKYD